MENKGHANIIPPKKGEPTRNPKGRGKGVRNRVTLLKELLKLKIDVPNPLKGKGATEKMEVEKALELQLIKKALQGDIRAIIFISEKLYGKIPQDVNLGGQEDNPVVQVDQKVVNLTVLERLIVKYGPESDQVKKYQEKYDNSTTD